MLEFVMVGFVKVNKDWDIRSPLPVSYFWVEFIVKDLAGNFEII
jgi:hypothetical protein